MEPIRIENTLARRVRFYEPNDPAVPAALAETPPLPPDLTGIGCPLPSRRREYTCMAKTGRALWLGAENGLTRYEPDAERKADRVMYFSADRELPDNAVENLIPDGSADDAVWVRTKTGAARIATEYITAEEKAEALTNETLQYVSRRGMVSQRELTVAKDPASAVNYGHSDNSGTFTAGFAIGELCKYAVYRRELGETHEKTLAAKQSAIRSLEACLLLCYIPCRGDGFVARTYLAPHEPIPEDGLFYRIENGKATCVDLPFARERGIAGKVIDAAAKIPERLTHLFTDEGLTLDGLVYKGDTSSDEITHHYLLFYFAHKILGAEEPELDALVRDRAEAILDHILAHGNTICECDGKPTTWARWDKPYFATPIGWSDACLNAAELLMFHRVAMYVTGSVKKYADSYWRLAIDEGYAALTAKHETRFFLSALSAGNEEVEELMYGDNSLATCAYWMLITLEPNEELKAIYKSGYRGWDLTFRREHNPYYDFPYLLCFPDAETDRERLTDWFRRVDITRLASPVSVSERRDVPKRLRMSGMPETSCLLMPDERAISKYDRNPFEYTNTHDGRGTHVLESCYVYTCAYWIGRYYGLIAGEGEA